MALSTIASFFYGNQGKKTVFTPSFLSLPMDVKLLICAKLGPEATARLGEVSKQFYELCTSDRVWKEFVTITFGTQQDEKEIHDSKEGVASVSTTESISSNWKSKFVRLYLCTYFVPPAFWSGETRHIFEGPLRAALLDTDISDQIASRCYIQSIRSRAQTYDSRNQLITCDRYTMKLCYVATTLEEYSNAPHDLSQTEGAIVSFSLQQPISTFHESFGGPNYLVNAIRLFCGPSFPIVLVGVMDDFQKNIAHRIKYRGIAMECAQKNGCAYIEVCLQPSINLSKMFSLVAQSIQAKRGAAETERQQWLHEHPPVNGCCMM